MEKVYSGGVALNCRWTGCEKEGDDVLLIHGLNTNMAFWHPAFLSILGCDRRVIMYDQRGHGYSELTATGYTTADLARDAISILDAYQTAKADIVSHSFGSGVALQIARLFPERVRSIVILDGRIRLLQPELTLGEWPEFDRWRSHFEAAGIALKPELDLDFTLPMYMQGGDIAEAGRRLETDGFLVPGTGRRAAEKYRKLVTETTAPADFKSNAGLSTASLRKTDCPVLAFYGSKSPFMRTLDGLRRELPNCRCSILPDGGHNFPLKFPEQTASVIVAFLESVVEELAAPIGTTET